MKSIKLFILALLAASIICIPLGACSSDNSSRGPVDPQETKQEESAPEPEQQEEEETPETTAKTSNADFDVTYVNVSDSGIDLTLYCSHSNVLILPNQLELNGTLYPMLVDGDVNPQIHLSANGVDDNGMIELTEGESLNVHVSVDGADGYSSFVLYFDETLWNDGNPKTYQIIDCKLYVSKR